LKASEELLMLRSMISIVLPSIYQSILRVHALSSLKDNEIEIDTWIEDANDNEKVRKILKIWFTLSATHNQQDWCKFPKILDDENFYAYAKEVLQNEAQSLGKLSIELLIVFRPLH